MKKLFAGCFFSIFILKTLPAEPTVSPNLVISQIYGDGGSNGAAYANDFIEIYNAGSTAIDLSNYSVQYSNGTVWNMTPLTTVVLQPGQYYLIQEGSHGSGGTPLPSPDAIGTLSILSNNGKVALVNSTSVLPNGCLSPLIIDLVGYGNANCFEGAATASASNITAIIRKTGNVDTDNNSTDFIISAPGARNSFFTLPISIGHFSGNKNGKNNNLHWKLNCTAASITFELQRSSNGSDFESIHKESASQARCTAPFQFTDTKPHGVNYYRLKIIADNRTTYSKIVLMTNTVSSRKPLHIYPTRVNAQATIKYFSNGAENIQWVISNIEGKIIKRFTGKVSQGENNIPLKMSNLSAGQYQLRGYTFNSTTDVVKFIKE